MLTTCAVTTAIRTWAAELIRRLYGGSDGWQWATDTYEFASFLAYGGGRATTYHPALMAVRGACLHALRSARCEAHAMHDDHDDAVARRTETDNIDCILGVLPALPTTATLGGWTPQRVIAAAARDIQVHIACDWHVACGSYQIHPDHTNLHTFRPSSEEAFRNLWGAVCSVDYGGKFGQQRLSYCDAINVTRREPPD